MLTASRVSRPGERVAAGAPERPGAERVDQPGLLGDRDEGGRGHRAGTGPRPAEERLGGDDLPAAGVVDRLIRDRELVAGDGAAEIAGDADAFAARRVDLGVVHEDPVLALLLGVVHRHIGPAQQFLGGEIGNVGDRDADARPDEDRLAADVER